MLFGCGMGIGLLFWAVAEPIYHMQSNPWIGGTTGIAASSPEAAEIALQLTFFHWGLHPWAIYCQNIYSMPDGTINFVTNERVQR
jgi:choline/glycine/proline betaine transport protein